MKIINLNTNHSYSIPKETFQYILNTYSYGLSKNIWRNYSIQTPNKDLELNYRGRLDSNGKETEMGSPELYYAIEEVISKGYCSTQQYPSIGCSIKWKN